MQELLYLGSVQWQSRTLTQSPMIMVNGSSKRCFMYYWGQCPKYNKQTKLLTPFPFFVGPFQSQKTGLNPMRRSSSCS
ncbi:hypothetical protein FJTKL_09883 [Diaporthe vaccinii]|uniref:Uncharacterized protein n=1 Tax=Diaporthe vaccinii TaxID=105482 RepID=A0ABR4EML0_9PEZI